MIIHTHGHTRTYEMEALLKLFRPAEKFAFSDAAECPEEEHISAVLSPSADGTQTLSCSARIGDTVRHSEITLDSSVQGFLLDREISGLLYPMLCDLTGMRPMWGMLTGIRPVNLLRKFAAQTGSVEAAAEEFRTVWHVSEEKTQLAEDILSVQQPILDAAPKNSVGIYLSVPFCPTRCRSR